MKSRILIQLDVDPQPSVFDGVVAVDAGVDHLFRHGGVTPEVVTSLVHGAMFTRGSDDLARTAFFVGGSDVAAAETILEAVKKTFFGPFRNSILFDPNGSNTTAAAAVLAAIDGLNRTRGSVDGATAVVLGGTGPVGQRVARLLLGLDGGVNVRLASRSREKAAKVCESLAQRVKRAAEPFDMSDPTRLLEGADVAIAAGAAGVELLAADAWQTSSLKVLIDLNAVPPAGIGGIEPGHKAKERDGRLCWGALGIGGTKMKIHRRAIESLFEANDRVIDAEECLEIGRGL